MKHEITRSEDGIYVPNRVMHISDGGQLIHGWGGGRAERWGVITLTLMLKQMTGKTHFILWLETSDSVPIPVCSDKSLKLSKTKCVKLTQSLPFEKPKQPQGKLCRVDITKCGIMTHSDLLLSHCYGNCTTWESYIISHSTLETSSFKMIYNNLLCRSLALNSIFWWLSASMPIAYFVSVFA